MKEQKRKSRFLHIGLCLAQPSFFNNPNKNKLSASENDQIISDEVAKELEVHARISL